jgi:protein TonB
MQHYNVEDRALRALSALVNDIKQLGQTEGAAQDAASGPVEPLGAPPAFALALPTPSRRLRLAALGGALAAHAGLLYGLMREPEEVLAGGGGQVEAISVTIVSSAALEARDVNLVAPPVPAAAAAIEADDGAAESAPATPRRQPEKQSEQSGAPDRPAPASAIVEAPSKAETETRKDREEAGAAPAVGGAAARGDAASPVRQSTPAAASPGAMREYARHVAQALAQARPKGTGSTGTVRVKLVIAGAGGLAAVEIARSSGNKRLDEAALAAVQRAVLPAPPPGATETQLTYEVPYHFR